MKKKTLLLLTTIIGRFERSCGTFGGGGGKNLLSSMTLFISLPKGKKNKKLVFIFYSKNNNDHGVDVSIIMVI
jgi:hypothetical protein